MSNGMLFMPNRPDKTYKNYGLSNITPNDLSSIPLSLYNPVNYLRRHEMGFNYISKLQPCNYIFYYSFFNINDI